MSQKSNSPVTETASTKFQTMKVLTVNASHFINDMFGAFLSPLLPRIIETLSLSLTQAGFLSSLYQIPSVLNPIIGDWADRRKNKYILAFAPAILATAMASIGLPDNYILLCIVVAIAGFATATYHAVAPPMVARSSGNRVGKGMSFQMAAGEMGRMVGPLVAVWAVSQYTLSGIWRMMFLGWAISIILAFRLKDIEFTHEERVPITAAKKKLYRFFIPIIFYFLFTKFLKTCLSIFLPTYLTGTGLTLTKAGLMYSVLQAAGVAGALVFGMLSDRIDKRVLLIALSTVTMIAMTAFIMIDASWALVPLLLVLGFFAISNAPILLSMVQEHFPNNRALANGIFMAISFAISPIHNISVGAMGDKFGLHQTFIIATVIYLLSIPAILAMPKKQTD